MLSTPSMNICLSLLSVKARKNNFSADTGCQLPYVQEGLDSLL